MSSSFVTQTGPLARMDLRRHRRYAVDSGTLQVSWLDKNGKMKITRTRALDISEDGMALQLPEEVMPLLVRFQSDQFHVEGVGAVRHCRRAGSKYVIGLEFTGGLHWLPPDGDVAEPIPLCDPGK